MIAIGKNGSYMLLLNMNTRLKKKRYLCYDEFLIRLIYSRYNDINLKSLSNGGAEISVSSSTVEIFGHE